MENIVLACFAASMVEGEDHGLKSRSVSSKRNIDQHLNPSRIDRVTKLATYTPLILPSA